MQIRYKLKYLGFHADFTKRKLFFSFDIKLDMKCRMNKFVSNEFIVKPSVLHCLGGICEAVEMNRTGVSVEASLSKENGA